jgi:hypothetical protein
VLSITKGLVELPTGCPEQYFEPGFSSAWKESCRADTGIPRVSFVEG